MGKSCGTARVYPDRLSYPLVMVEFPDMAALRRFYDSPEYQKAAAIRQKVSKSRLIFVEGV